MMKALILTFDKYKTFASHTILSYQKLWPENPFHFVIPYQDEAVKEYFEKSFGEKVEMIKSPPGIKDTMITLLDGYDDEEWVYWCMDDRYLISFDKDEYIKTYKWIQSISNKKIASVKCISRPGANAPNHLYYWKGRIKNKYNQTFLLRKSYSMIWIHQFLRIKVLKDLFENIPRDLKSAKEMDYIVNNLTIPNDYYLYNMSKSVVILGESTTEGKITKNCYDSLINNEIEIPEGFQISEDITYSGDNKSIAFKTYFYFKWFVKFIFFQLSKSKNVKN